MTVRRRRGVTFNRLAGVHGLVRGEILLRRGGGSPSTPLPRYQCQSPPPPTVPHSLLEVLWCGVVWCDVVWEKRRRGNKVKRGNEKRCCLLIEVHRKVVLIGRVLKSCVNCDCI